VLLSSVTDIKPHCRLRYSV